LNIVIFGARERSVKATGPLNTAAAAKALGVSKATLLRWFREGKTVDVSRDRNGWRIFTRDDLQRIRRDLGIGR
jgi:DNA-binding transcriptional MerR regulator